MITPKIGQEYRHYVQTLRYLGTVVVALTKEATASPIPELEPAFGVSIALADAAIHDWEQIFYKNKWLTLNPIRHTQVFLSESNQHASKFFLPKSGKIYGILSDHNSLTGHTYI